MDRTPEEIKKWLQCCQFDDEGCKNCDECPYLMNGCGSSKNYRDALAYIQQLEAQVPRWIPVEERLPEELHQVLVLMRSSSGWIMKAIDSRSKGKWLIYPDNNYRTVTHWMPLPEAPKEEHE